MTESVPDSEKRQKWLTFAQGLNPDVPPQAHRLMDEMRMVSHTLYQIGENSIEKAGLSFAQYRILMGLLFSERMDGRSELNPSEISERQGTSRNTISSLIRSLEDRELIERYLDKKDRRKFNICLTEDGRSLVLQHANRHMETISQCFSALNSDEQTTLSQLLNKLGNSLSKSNQ